MRYRTMGCLNNQLKQHLKTIAKRRNAVTVSRNRNRGFTLIELLVAIGILAIVAVLGWRGLDGIVRSRATLTAEIEETRSLQLTFAQLQSDCAQNVNLLSYPNLTEGRSVWIEPQRLILIRNEYADNRAPAMQVVVYRIKDSNLTRFESIPTRDLTVLSQLLLQARNPPDDQVEVVMQKNIQDIQFSGYPESSLRANSDTDAENNLPPPDNSGGGVNPNNDKKNPDGSPAKGAPQPGSGGAQNNNGQNGGKQDSGVQKVNQAKVTTGLQVSLQLQKHENKITKIFMFGGA